ncbi:RNA polymerase sigma factor sigK Sigma-K factor [Fibrella aestuarina BUZ 2]|uniref:RNA polymerase sigma factor sigK Sigma-K factor n=1 Tax=Fibrella aestuarina BUZ 2 TaxID=1166018 RepID=I0KGG7_9BACT|nr:RNA polymerase sigma factor sigK Sigma-K factor [Fibrella aestuarina BUZ 2]
MGQVYVATIQPLYLERQPLPALSKRSPLATESVLVEKLLQRDEQAFQWLYKHYSAALYGVLLKIVREEEQAQDLLQEVFIKIWNNTATYDTQKGRLFTWMLNIARNTGIDAVRSGKAMSRPSSAQTLSTDDAGTFAVDREYAVAPENPDHIGLREVIQKLRPDRKQLIDLVYFGGYTHEEAADELGLPLGTVKTRIRSALQELKQLFR